MVKERGRVKVEVLAILGKCWDLGGTEEAIEMILRSFILRDWRWYYQSGK